MISVAALRGPAAAGYYLQHEGCDHAVVQDLARDATGTTADGVGYYLNGRDAPGRWVGGGAHALGLTGSLDAAQGPVLEQLLAGSHGGQRLVPSVWRRDQQGRRVDVRRAGFDVTLSAPKSVSTLMALAPPEVTEQIVAAHEQAAAEALRLLERLAARAARGHQGDGQRAPRIATSGFVGACFTHTTSRALDPQLHTHVVIANLAQGVDGRWSALDSRTLHREATTASYLYQHLLRAELTGRLGVGWTDVARGVAEVDGIPAGVRREFSTRRRQIEAALHDHGHDRDLGEACEDTSVSAGRLGRARRRARHLAARAACLATRTVKTHADQQSLRASWAQRAAAAGFSLDDAKALLATRHAAPSADLTSIGRAVLTADGVTREATTFTQGTVLRELIARLPGGAPVSTAGLLAAAADLVAEEEVLPVLTDDGPAYTTRELLHTEAETVTLATRTGQPLAALDRQHVIRQLVRQPEGRRPDQQRTALALVTSGRPVEVVAGPAGSGKTAGLRAATQRWQQAGVPVAGTAVAAMAAQGLEQATGTPAVCLARLMTNPDRHLPSEGVLLVDEAGMVGTRTLHALLLQAQQRRCKVVLVGDPQQLPELEAGGMFARLATEPTALHLDGHHRQTHAWERDALQAFRDGHLSEALDSYRKRDRLHTGPDTDTVHADAVNHYLTARTVQPDPWQTVLLGSSRQEVHDLNDRVRRQLLAAGALGHERLEVDTPDSPVEYRRGDQVIVTRNDHHRGLLNGTTATVTDVSGHGLQIATTSGRVVDVDRAWLAEGRLDHGYAMTLHKAQGRTVHTALLVGTDTLTRQAGYVGLSRGTHANHLFLSQPDLHALSQDCSSRVRYLRPAAPQREAGAFSRDARQRLASTSRLRDTHQPHGRSR